ncbi:MAG: carboxypeptidase-like regulatory domain-containing protein [Flavobacteriaceae bacterium]|nr:carboxypeptidase-like regulatory domain-containing protein [Flavobacteriaceae bacterium]
MKRTILMVFFAFLCYGITAQNIVKGVVVDSDSEKPIEHVKVILNSKLLVIKTTNNGVFIIKNNTNGMYILELKLQGYETQKFSIQFTGKTIDLGTILFYKNRTDTLDLSVITLSDDELNDDTTTSDNISGLLQASKDIYLRTAAYEFSASFFRVKGLGSENGSILINGIEFNKIYNGRPQWSNWGGLNDVTNNQEFNAGLSPSSYTFGKLLGVTNINIRPKETRTGTKISYASSNRSYNHRIMITHASGVLKNDWAFTFSASSRTAKEGYSDGTFYDANSFFASIEKRLNKNSSINISAIISANKRGKSSANTQEVFDLKGTRYNSYWGFQNGEIRNSRIKEVVEPIILLNHYWNLNSKSTLQTNIGYQFGKVSNSRIDYNGSKIDGAINSIPTIVRLGGSNPDPSYYQKLPSYALRQNYPNVYRMEQHFIEDGQLDWKQLYLANQNPFNNSNTTYVLYEDRNDDKLFIINSIFETEITDHVLLNASIQLKQLHSENYAKILDLLGGKGFLDIDNFAENTDRKQNDFLHPNRIASKAARFKYNYTLEAKISNGFIQAQFNYNKIDAFIAGSISSTSYQRIGQYQNGKFKGQKESLGASEQLIFMDFGFKAGLTSKITGRHLVHLNLAYVTKPPTLQNSFSNVRISNSVVKNLTSEKTISADLSYVFRSPILQAKISGYFTKREDLTAVSFYYADGIGGSDSENTAFVQEVLTGVGKKHFGIEIGIEAQVTSVLKLKGAANIGQYTFDNSPNLALNSESENFQFKSRTSHLKNYKLPVGPQKAYSFGFEYRAPEYWWIGATVNFFDGIYVDINPLTRTTNFSDDGGIPFNDYDSILAKKLLEQEQFKNYSIVNFVGGKTWKIDHYYIGFFASISNLLNTQYKTGGFEQGRNANFRELRDDKALEKPVFGNKYWYGRGTTYFLNLTIRI